MVESQELRRSGRQTGNHPNYQESDSDGSEEDIYEFNDLYRDDDPNEDEEEPEEPLPLAGTTTQRSRESNSRTPSFLSAARDSSLAVHRIEIPDIVQVFPIAHSAPDIIESDTVDYGSPNSTFMGLFEIGIRKIFEATQPRFKQLIIDRINNNRSETKQIVYFPLTLKDVKAFMGALYLMDLYKFPEVQQYWGMGGSLIKSWKL